MQIRKDEIKNRITAAALTEFSKEGYQGASMRGIAMRAGITVGNIYSYFPGKSALLDYVLEKTMDDVNGLFTMQIPAGYSPSEAIEFMARGIVEVYRANRVQFLILMNKSEGSDYEDVKAELIRHATQRMIAEFIPRLGEVKNGPLLAESISVALVEGVLNIINRCGENEEMLFSVLSGLLRIIFSDLK